MGRMMRRTMGCMVGRTMGRAVGRTAERTMDRMVTWPQTLVLPSALGSMCPR